MPTYKLIVNPVSGRGHTIKMLPVIESKLKEAGLDYGTVVTERPWHAALLAEQAVYDGFDTVVAVGGDGTSNEVINGLMAAKKNGKNAVMGVLSVGRGNDFAFGAGVPTDCDNACRALSDYHTRRIDIGWVKGGLVPEGRYFGNGVGIGFDAVVGFESLKVRPLTGFIGYLVAALRTIYLYFDAPEVIVQLDGETLQQNALMVSIMNGKRMGGGFMMAPDGNSEDGYLNICLVDQVTRPEIFRLIPRFMKGTQFGHPAVKAIKTSQISVTGLNGASLPAHADGETVNLDGKHLEIRILPQELELIVASAEGAV